MVIVYDNYYAEIDEITELLNDKISYLTEPTNFDSIAELSDILNLDDQLESDEARLSGMEAKKYKARGRNKKYPDEHSDNYLPLRIRPSNNDYLTFIEGPNNFPKIPTYYLSRKQFKELNLPMNTTKN